METSLEATVKYLLIAMFIFISFGNFMNLMISPQAYLLCFKLRGLTALLYLFINGLIALILMGIIIRKSTLISCATSLCYFSFHLLNSIIVSITIFKVPAFSTISLIGVILSLIPLLRALARR